MTERKLLRRERRLRRAGRALAAALIGLPTTLALADMRSPARPHSAPPMRFVRVTSADPACGPNCPQWLSAEGQIELGSANAFSEAVERLNGRRLPIFIHSRGGSVRDAIAMGELIRAKGLAVAVARTLLPNCPMAAPKCQDGAGQAITGGAECASACMLVLAGGVERLAGPNPLIGVHQTTTTVKEIEGTAHLTSTRKLYEQKGVDAALEAYLAAMGVGDPVMTLMRKTPAASIRWLSLAELKDSRLATQALDAAEPVVSKGANGLNARSFEDGPPSADLFQASITKPIAGGGATLGIALRYRRGGGVVEAELRDTLGPTDTPARDMTATLAAGGGEPVELRADGTAPARALIPRERFCALAHSGATITASASDGAKTFPAPALSAMDGATALIAEACP